ncbi:YbaB/EbfC family nucleoid-associated protein [Actinomadura parmotrematis]|uniref:YbaB/EbfC family nucleoid-associated protein n=1 Tax=Actinomadura parmotrematis TaxID=2864039 RepID=A0ABS7FUR2_9ACTN|nr:YbaB/EbfC family nucleoid-associated protein [Actinomadura parmotrematis]MBW8484153.1 YbaB/EbfC family nucleoid-associated protein [Actinomadura parmotrematis]
MESPEDALARLSADAQQKIRQYQELRTDLGTMSGAAQSEDRTVSVTVAPGGAVTGIQLTDRALRHGPNGLARLLMETIARASADVSRRLAERVQELTPNMDVVAMVEARLPALDDPAAGERR